MIGLDTNVLVRFLVEDDEEQTKAVRHRLQEAVTKGERCFVSDIVLCELVWVLERRYKVSRIEILENLRKLLHSQHVVFSSVQRIETALLAFESEKGDFADYLIREHSRQAGCDLVLTFDRALHQSSGFVAPK